MTSEITRRAELLRDQVKKTWSPPLDHGGERPADIAQTCTMQAIAFMLGRDFLGELTPNQEAAIEQGLSLMERTLLPTSPPQDPATGDRERRGDRIQRAHDLLEAIRLKEVPLPAGTSQADCFISLRVLCWVLMDGNDNVFEAFIAELEAKVFAGGATLVKSPIPFKTRPGGDQPAETPLLKYMTEPELNGHIGRQMRFIKACQTADTVGSMLVIFQDDGITQYGATIDPETAPAALRELADRLERRETVERDG